MNRLATGGVRKQVARVNDPGYRLHRLDHLDRCHAVGDVDLSVTYGPTGADYTGTLAQPAIGDVRSGTQYGAGGTEYTGTLTPGGGGGGVFIVNE